MLLTFAKSADILNSTFGLASQISIGVRSSCWLGLYTTTPNSSGSGGVEVTSSNNNYARIRIDDKMTVTNNSREAYNNLDINFNAAVVPSDPASPTGADWGTITGFGLFTASTGGTAYAWGHLDSAITVSTHNTLHFIKNQFKVKLTDPETEASAQNS